MTPAGHFADSFNIFMLLPYNWQTNRPTISSGAIVQCNYLKQILVLFSESNHAFSLVCNYYLRVRTGSEDRRMGREGKSDVGFVSSAQGVDKITKMVAYWLPVDADS